MNDRQLRGNRGLHAAHIFLTNRRISDPELLIQRDELGNVIARLTAAADSQFISHRGLGHHGKFVNYQRTELRALLLKVSRRAKIVLKGLPGIEDAVRVPPYRANAAEYVDAARRIADAVRPHAKAFRASKFPPNFIKQIEQSAAALEAEASRPNEAMISQSTATKDIKELFREGRAIIDSIDATIASVYRKEPSFVDNWRRAKKIGGRIGRPRKRKPPQ